MPQSKKIEVEWQEDTTIWVVTGGKLEDPIVVSTVELRDKFPEFVKAAEEFVSTQTSPLSEDDLELLLGGATASLAEILPARQRFAVYRALAFFLGYAERTKLPDVLEETIKKTWM